MRNATVSPLSDDILTGGEAPRVCADRSPRIAPKRISPAPHNEYIYATFGVNWGLLLLETAVEVGKPRRIITLVARRLRHRLSVLTRPSTDHLGTNVI